MSFPKFIPRTQNQVSPPATPATPATKAAATDPSVAVVAGGQSQNRAHPTGAHSPCNLKPSEAAELVGSIFPGSRLTGIEPRLHWPADRELPAIEQGRELDGSLGLRFRLAWERGMAVFGEWPLPEVKLRQRFWRDAR